jgi:hypothetical protein
MRVKKKSDLLTKDIANQLLTNLDGALQFKNMNKIQWNNLSAEDRATFFMNNVFHDGVDPRIKDHINGLIDGKIDTQRDELLRKMDTELRTKSMTGVITQLVEHLNFNEI